MIEVHYQSIILLAVKMISDHIRYFSVNENLKVDDFVERKISTTAPLMVIRKVHRMDWGLFIFIQSYQF